MRTPMSAASHDRRRGLPETPSSADIARDQEAKLSAARERGDQLERELSRRKRELDDLHAQIRELENANSGLGSELDGMAWRAVRAARRVTGRSPRLARLAFRAMQVVWWTLTFQLFARIRRYRAARKIGERV
jgi:septal ring factor EnvC (AmiA/AmiB activator)